VDTVRTLTEINVIISPTLHMGLKIPSKDDHPALSFSRHDVSFDLVWRINLRNEEVGSRS
jgi:hypothetical protein